MCTHLARSCLLVRVLYGRCAIVVAVNSLAGTTALTTDRSRLTFSGAWRLLQLELATILLDHDGSREVALQRRLPAAFLFLLNLLAVVKLLRLALLVRRRYFILLLYRFNFFVVLFMDRSLVWEGSCHESSIAAEFALIFLTLNLLFL